MNGGLMHILKENPQRGTSVSELHFFQLDIGNNNN